ncbi:MAG: potassium channel family protein [Bulleidia sp.]
MRNNRTQKKILIAGGFHEAQSLARSLLEKGYEVTVINRNQADCEKLAEIERLNVIYGDAGKKFILEDADAGSCRVAIALSGSDETNLIICEMCREFFHVEKTVCLLSDPSKTEFFYQMGVDRVVCALNMIAGIMEENALKDEMMNMIPIEEGRIHIAEAPVLHGSSLIGRKLWELNLPKGIIIGCILRGDQNLIPRGDTGVREGDILLMITSDRQKLEQVRELTGKI